ncbi:hypothetical protein T4B_15016 [Trichinella pseudospiralis]|uniref:Uncharacterized protein n=2 Tax=Trichinella pseudospiralis TaxID=6337 RepID=A0A0V1JHT3_TRIPS|nr:hypothetical protein T4A_5728 [Trichinella pseudospiralis]KRY84245.1 hypothetical protein T4D_3946 [Trichinella pseudospiralis]KRZ25041.1 hypothetical protein T4B_15016 [Trichinella pseudospiralis]KRZ34446.1 hypothetical protein T4C_2833 [Trichinella pseudospiralis]
MHTFTGCFERHNAFFYTTSLSTAANKKEEIQINFITSVHKNNKRGAALFIDIGSRRTATAFHYYKLLFFDQC